MSADSHTAGSNAIILGQKAMILMIRDITSCQSELLSSDNIPNIANLTSFSEEYFSGHKTEVFLFKNNPKNLGP